MAVIPSSAAELSSARPTPAEMTGPPPAAAAPIGPPAPAQGSTAPTTRGPPAHGSSAPTTRGHTMPPQPHNVKVEDSDSDSDTTRHKNDWYQRLLQVLLLHQRFESLDSSIPSGPVHMYN